MVFRWFIFSVQTVAWRAQLFLTSFISFPGGMHLIHVCIPEWWAAEHSAAETPFWPLCIYFISITYFKAISINMFELVGISDTGICLNGPFGGTAWLSSSSSYTNIYRLKVLNHKSASLHTLQPFNAFLVLVTHLLLNVSLQPGKDSAGLLLLMGRNLEETAQQWFPIEISAAHTLQQGLEGIGLCRQDR